MMARSLSRSCMLRCTRRHSYFCIWVLVAVAVIRRSREPWFEKRRSAYIMVDMCASACGLGNQMFRYAAWRSLAGQYPNRSACVLWDPGLLAAHPHSALAQHVEGVERAETCLWTDAATVRFEPPHSIYRPFPALTDGRDIVLSGCMQSFRYFEGRLRAPIFRLKQQEAARLWLAEHGLTSVVHVRRGDKLADGSVVVPLAYYEAALRRIGTSRVAVCTDDPAWVRRQPLFAHATLCPPDTGLGMALMVAATEAVAIGMGTFGWWGAYLSEARRKYIYHRQYWGAIAAGYNASDYIPPTWIRL